MTISLFPNNLKLQLSLRPLAEDSSSLPQRLGILAMPRHTIPSSRGLA